MMYIVDITVEQEPQSVLGAAGVWVDDPPLGVGRHHALEQLRVRRPDILTPILMKL